MKVIEQAYEVDRPLVETDDPIQSSRRSRPLLLLERTMYREGCTPFTGVFTVKLLGALKEGRLRQALAVGERTKPAAVPRVRQESA